MAHNSRPASLTAFSYVLKNTDFKSNEQCKREHPEDDSNSIEKATSSKHKRDEPKNLIRCANEVFGCKSVLTVADISDHTVICPFRQVNCPLYYVLEVGCPWFGHLSKVLKHLEVFHDHVTRTEPVFECKAMESCYRVVIFKEEVFLYYKKMAEGILHAFVRRMGITQDKYRIVFNLKAQDDSHQSITLSTRADLLDSTVTDIFASGRCIIVGKEVLNRYVDQNEMNFWITIEVWKKETTQSAY